MLQSVAVHVPEKLHVCEQVVHKNRQMSDPMTLKCLIMMTLLLFHFMLFADLEFCDITNEA